MSKDGFSELQLKIKVGIIMKAFKEKVVEKKNQYHTKEIWETPLLKIIPVTETQSLIGPSPDGGGGFGNS